MQDKRDLVKAQMRTRRVQRNRLVQFCFVHCYFGDFITNTHIQCTYTQIAFFCPFFRLRCFFCPFDLRWQPVCLCVHCTNNSSIFRMLNPPFRKYLRSFIFYQSIVQTDLTLCMHKSLKYVFIGGYFSSVLLLSPSPSPSPSPYSG